MESFEGLGLSPEIVEGLAAEGIEVPTTLQGHAIPVLQRGNSAILRAGPGAGILATYGPVLLERLRPGGHQPGAVALAPTRGRADGLATSLARLATTTGHRVAALGTPWALASHADILFAHPGDLLEAVRSAQVKLDRVEVVILDGAAALLEAPEREAVEALMDAVPHDGVQWVVISDPLGESVREFAEHRLPRVVILPPEAAADGDETSPVDRGRLEAWVVEGRKEEALVAFVHEALRKDHRHVLLFFRSDDDAADGGDLLSLHGYAVGAPGAPDAPVWVGSDPMEAREALRRAVKAEHPVTVASVDVPSDGDILDRRHGAVPQGGAVMVHPRELPHLRRVAAVAGYSVTLRSGRTTPDREEVESFLRGIEEALDREDLGPYLVLLEPLLQRRGSVEVAAALAAILRRKQEPAATRAGSRPGLRPSRSVPDEKAPQAWVKVFLSIGKKDGVGPGDLVGAITGEAGVQGSQVGHIEIRDTFSRVDVQEEVAGKVIRALNGVTVRGRSVRADYDRPEGRAPKGGPDRGRTAGPPRKRKGPPRPEK